MNTKPMSSSASQPAARPSIVQLALKGKGELHAAYIPLFKEGGIFIASTREYKLGDDVYILLTLPEDTQRYPVTGKVAWITPARAAGNRIQGVGVRFSSDEKSRMLKATIEEVLGSQVGSSIATNVI